MPDNASTSEPASQRWSETPWFWLLVFSGMALMALVAVTPKYRQRQGRLIRQFEARQSRPSINDRESTAGKASTAPPASAVAAAEQSAATTQSVPPLATDAARRIERRSRLAPLLLLIGMLFAAGVLALLVQHRWRTEK